MANGRPVLNPQQQEVVSRYYRCLPSYKYRLSRKSLENTYKSFNLPILYYADVVWNNCTIKMVDELEQLHLDAIRTITVVVTKVYIKNQDF